MPETKDKPQLTRTEIKSWLLESDEDRLQELWDQADLVRRTWVGNGIQLRGIIAFSNHCVCMCQYCGINAANKGLHRYRMTQREILATVKCIELQDNQTVVLQSGENPDITGSWVTEMIRQIKSETNMSITLSLGVRSEVELAEWKTAGADRYLLKFETSNRELYKSLHPGNSDIWEKRLRMLQTLARLGYEVGSGIMVGIPGQGLDDLANDLKLFRELDLDMIGIGPYIPHSETGLGKSFSLLSESTLQVPNNDVTTFKMLALARIVCPLTNIPATSALSTVNTSNGRRFGLQCGANVVMTDMTPATYRKHYDIYPTHLRGNYNIDKYMAELKMEIKSLGRRISCFPGISRNFEARQKREKTLRAQIGIEA